MLTRVIIALSILINVDVPFQRADAAEPHAEVIFSKIIKTKQAILAADESTTPAKYVFLAIWDFDGTILHGDCSEGLKIDNKPIYKGLAQLCIEEGHSEIYPVTWSDGKTEKLKEIIKKTQSDHPGKQVVVLAGFGNSFNTDGPFMKYVASQHLPAGKPISVMINGGETPADYQNLFIEVQQSKLSTK